MRKNRFIKKLFLLPTIIIAPIVTYSCGQVAQDDYANFDYSHIDFNTYNKWFDDDFNKIYTRKVIDNLESLKYDYTFDSTARSNYIMNASIRENILDSEYTMDQIKNDLFFINNIENKAQYIHNFVDAYMKWNNSNILGYKNPHYSENPNNNIPKRTLIYSEGGPFGTIDNNSLTSSVFPAKWTYTNDNYKYGSNVLPITFNQPLYDFIPHSFLMSLNTSTLDGILAHINDKTARDEYLKKIDNGTIKDFDTFKIMLGITNENASQIFELVSASFAEISKLRKHALIKHLVNENYVIYQMGFSYGFENVAQDVLLDPYILYNTNKFFIGRNYLNKYVQGSLRSSGGILTSGMEKESTGNSTVISTIMFFSIGYYKSKYGFLNAYKEMIKKNTKFASELQSKWIVETGDSDYNVGRITPIEKEFYESNNIDYNEYHGGHNKTINILDIQKRFLGLTTNDIEINAPKYFFS